MKQRDYYAWLSLSRDCNNRCTWCYERNCAPCQPKSSMEVIAEIDHIKKLGINYVILLGGEPTLYQELEVVIDYIKFLKMQVTIITNGRRLADGSFNHLIEKMLQVNVTIHSLGPAVHDAITGVPGSLDETLEGTNQIVNVKKIVHFNFVVGEANFLYAYHDIIEIVQKRHLVSVSCAGPLGINEETGNANLLHPKKFAELVEALTEHKYGRIKPLIVFEAPLCFLKRRTLDRLLKARMITTGCKVHDRSRLIISAEGRILACAARQNETVAERIEEIKSLADLDRRLMAQSKRLLRPMYQVCKGCELWRICRGGCPSVWKYWELRKEVTPIR